MYVIVVKVDIFLSQKIANNIVSMMKMQTFKHIVAHKLQFFKCKFICKLLIMLLIIHDITSTNKVI